MLLADGRALAWGANTDAGLGIGVETVRPDGTWSQDLCVAPTLVRIDEPIAKLATNAAVTVSGKLFVWGINGNGQLGLPVGEYATGALRRDRIITPTCLPDTPFIVDVKTSSCFILALAADGKLLTAGDDRSSQLSRPLGPMAHEFDEQGNYPDYPEQG